MNPDTLTSLRYVAGAPHLWLPPGRWVVQVRLDRRHGFRAVATVDAPAEGFLYPIGGETDDVRARKVEG